MIKVISKRNVTLLEMLIAMSLTALILMTLTFFYSEVGYISGELDKVKKQEFYISYVENRLMGVLPKIVSPTDQAKDFVFFSVGDEGITMPGSQSLIFTFDNGISFDRPFSNNVIGRLYLDVQGRFSLAYWPSPKRWEGGEWPMKKEILLEKVKSLHFEYFIAPEKKDIALNDQGKAVAEKPENNSEGKPGSDPAAAPPESLATPEPKGEWRSEGWSKEFKSLPVMVKVILELQEEGEKLIFIFPLINAKAHIIYAMCEFLTFHIT